VSFSPRDTAGGLPVELLARAARVAGAPPEELIRAAGRAAVVPVAPEPAAVVRASSSSSSKPNRRRRRARTAAARARLEGLREMLARHARISAPDVAGKLPREFDGETRGACLAIVRDGSQRTAIERVLALPIGQAERILPASGSERPDFPRLAAAAVASWEVARRTPLGGVYSMVEGVCERAYVGIVLRPDGRRYSHSTLWGMAGPFRELAARGVYKRHQPPAGTTPYDGKRRCAASACRRELTHAEGCCPFHPGAGVRQFAVGQTQYAKSRCGRSALSLIRRGRGPARELAFELVERFAPWLLPEVPPAPVDAPPVELELELELAHASELAAVQQAPRPAPD
jgi:hypothetical protein